MTADQITALMLLWNIDCMSKDLQVKLCKLLENKMYNNIWSESFDQKGENRQRRLSKAQTIIIKKFVLSPEQSLGDGANNSLYSISIDFIGAD